MAISQSLSSVGCIGQFRPPQQALRLRGTPASCSPSLRIRCNVAVDVSKAVVRLKERGIEPTPKVVHHLKKKEIWKARRRERKEKQKADRMIHPVWYAWSEKDSLEERNKLAEEEAEELRTDEFLCFVRDERPATRIVTKGEATMEVASQGNAAMKASVRPRKPKIRMNTVDREVNRVELRPEILLEQRAGELKLIPNGDWKAAHRERLQEFAEEPPKHPQETFSTFSKPSMTSPPNSPQMAISQDKHQNEDRIEDFFDIHDEGESQKGPDVWVRGVGNWKRKKPPATEEFKQMLLSQRKGDLKLLNITDEDSDAAEDLSSPFEFIGRSAVVEDKRIQKLAARLNETDYWTSKVQFKRLMHSGRLKMTEDRVLRIVQILGEFGNWRRAMQVVRWIHKRQLYADHKSRYVFTTLLAVLRDAHRPVEALNVFTVMRENFSSYPDMAAYHTVAVTLGQAGLLKELLELIEVLADGPKERMKNVPLVHWDPRLLPDVVVYNAVLNACVPSKEWRGVLWTWEQLEKSAISPNAATFGLTIEAMVKAGQFNQAIRFYKRMERAGFPPNAQTYKCLVEVFGKSKKSVEAVQLVNEMEASGIIGTASVYYALACSFCISGRLKEALVQVSKIQQISSKKDDVITYTGLIKACHEGGHIHDAIFLFKHMQQICVPNVEACNVMIKIYGRNFMFDEARSLYEAVKKGGMRLHENLKVVNRLRCNAQTFELMLKASAVSQNWDYFDCVYKDMILQGYHLCGRTNLWVMVRVAKKGKIDLVDDMISRLKEAGDVPDPSLYRAQMMSCLHEGYILKAAGYLNNMRRDGSEAASAMHFIKNNVRRDIWDSFSQHVWDGFSQKVTSSRTIQQVNNQINV